MDTELQALIDDYQTLVVCNHSGGKDSQAMYLLLRNMVPRERLVVIHSHLPEVEWSGTLDHIRNTVDHELHVVQAGKTFFEMVEHRQMWPSPKNRQCTSDLKRGPIAKKIRQICNERGFIKVLNCMGLRAQESSARAKKVAFRQVPSQSNSKRVWFEWLPIHDWNTDDVFHMIDMCDQEPHWAYLEGMTRLSCCFCIMASEEDLCTAARLNPVLFQKYVDMERKIGHTLIMPSQKNGKRYLDQVVSDALAKKEVKETQLSIAF